MNLIKKFFMKDYERKLYDDLQSNKEGESYLGKVKNAIGAEILSSKYVPKFKAEVALTITISYEQTGAFIVPALLPANLQTNVPVYLFGLTDFQGAYARSRNLVQSISWNPASLLVGINGFAFAAPPGSQVGDVIMIFQQVGFTGLPPNDNRVFVNIHCNNVAYATFLNSLSSDLLTLNLLKYIVPAANLAQFNNPLNLIVQSLLGKLATDTIDPNIFITGQTMQTNISDIPIKLPIDKNLILATLVDWDCVNINLLLSVLSMQPLTNRYK